MLVDGGPVSPRGEGAAQFLERPFRSLLQQFPENLILDDIVEIIPNGLQKAGLPDKEQRIGVASGVDRAEPVRDLAACRCRNEAAVEVNGEAARRIRLVRL